MFGHFDTISEYVTDCWTEWPAYTALALGVIWDTAILEPRSLSRSDGKIGPDEWRPYTVVPRCRGRYMATECHVTDMPGRPERPRYDAGRTESGCRFLARGQPAIPTSPTPARGLGSAVREQGLIGTEARSPSRPMVIQYFDRLLLHSKGFPRCQCGAIEPPGLLGTPLT